MFGGDPFDPFGQMRRQMAEMDQMHSMMNQMLGGMMGGHPMLGSGQQQSQRRQQQRPNDALDLFGGFGGFGMGGGLMRMMEQSMNDPNAMVISQSTCITMGPDGQQRVVQNSNRRVGDIRETRRTVRNGNEEHVAIGHHIGDRAHVIEKKRDKDGRVRQNQKFVGIDEDEAHNFNEEFKTRANRNLSFDPFGRPTKSNQRAIDNGRRSSSNRTYEVEQPGSSSQPIIEVPDDDDEDYVQETRPRDRGNNGPMIRELSEEEADMESSKRRRGMFGNFFKN